MKITLESENNKIAIEMDGIVDLAEVVESLIIPALLAYGFQEKSINEVFNYET